MATASLDFQPPEEQTVRTSRTPAGSLLETQPYCVQTDGLELVASYEAVQCWGPKDRFEKHCFREYYAIMLRQENMPRTKVLKLVRVTRWGGTENVFTMNVHF